MVPVPQSTIDLDHLRQPFTDQGLEFLGVAGLPDAQQQGEARQRYRHWLAEGHNGTMNYLERHEPGKYDPGFALPGTRSVLVVGLGYFQNRPELPPGRAQVARYAWGRDYHKVLLGKLKTAVSSLQRAHPGHEWRTFTDTAPLDERWWAAQAGGAFTARNTLAINRVMGSWFLLGEVLTTLEVAPTLARSHAHGSCPSGCRRCTTVCPTGALTAEGTMNASRCISYLTIEHRGPIADEWKPLIGAWVFGCDLCQEVCPFNLPVAPTQESQFLAWKAGPHLDLAELLLLDQQAFTARFGGSPVHRTGRNGLVRNACIAAANTGQIALFTRLKALCDDADPGVADAAVWAVSRLAGDRA